MNGKERRIDIKFCNFITMILTMLIILVVLFPSILTAGIFLAVVIISTFKEPSIAYVGWIIGYAFFTDLTNATGILGYLVISPLILHGFIIQLFKGIRCRIPINLTIFLLLLIITSFLSLIFSRSPKENIIALGMLLTAIFIVIFAINAIKNCPRTLGIFNQAYIFIIFAVLITTIISGNFFGVGRLRTGNNVRAIANVAAPASLILYIELIFAFNKEKRSVLNNRFPIYILILLFIISMVALISTVSRGAYLATAITFFCVFFMDLFIKKKKVYKFLNRIVFFIVVIVLIWLLVGFVQKNVTGGYMNRVTIEAFGDNTRWEIWEAAFSQMKGHEYLIGAGPNSFTQLSIIGGYDYYAHSVFVDSFITLGLIGFLELFVFLLYILIKFVKNKDLFAVGMLVLSICLYTTHGNLTGSMGFWVLIAISYASNYIRNLNIRY